MKSSDECILTVKMVGLKSGQMERNMGSIATRKKQTCQVFSNWCFFFHLNFNYFGENDSITFYALWIWIVSLLQSRRVFSLMFCAVINKKKVLMEKFTNKKRIEVPIMNHFEWIFFSTPSDSESLHNLYSIFVVLQYCRIIPVHLREFTLSMQMVERNKFRWLSV